METLAALALITYSRLLTPDAAPSARFDPPLIFAASDKALLLFGGSDNTPRNDLWRYSTEANRWVELRPTGAIPAARFGHVTVYDPVRKRLILMGGQAGGFFSDVWAYDLAGNQWTQLAKDGAGPSSRYGHSGIYDRTRDRLVVSHGFTNSGRFDDTWAFGLADNRWSNVTPSGAKPLKRCLHHAAYDEAHDQFLLFGGCSSGFGKCPQDDLWSYDLKTQTWKQLPGGPPARERYAIAFDVKRGRLLVFGGSGFPLLNDTWAYDTQQKIWTVLNVTGEVPSARSRVEGVYAEGLDAVYWFGGQTDTGLSNELFRLEMTAAGARIDRIVNAFSGQGGAIAPGELVSLFGTGLGEPVTFDGNSARVLYGSATQINIRVPVELVPGSTAAVTAGEARGSTGVTAAHPGLFARVFHGDGSANDAANPATAGSAVVLYATGTGSAPVQISVGGIPAEVLYSGALAGADGVTQINIRVPLETPSGSSTVAIAGGNAVPVSIR